MASITIGLNATGGSNRIRFEKLSERLQKVNIDILHQVRSVGALQTTETVPDSGELGCFFQDELEQCKKLETSRHFRKFYFEMSQLTQSLPELIHHQTKVVSILTKQISSVVPQDLPSYFSLVSVLARDLKDDLKAHFHALVQCLQGVVDKVTYSSMNVKGNANANPELTGKLFETLSHLLKAQWDVLSQDPDCLRQYYGPLLGSSTGFVRDFAAKSFVLVIRKCSSKTFKSHMKKVIFALATNSQLTLKDAYTSKEVLLECEPLEATVQERDSTEHKSVTHKSKRMFELFEGVSLLMFYSAKGVKGRIHSKAIERLRALWGLLLPLPASAVETIKAELVASGGKKGAAKKGKALEIVAGVAYDSLSEESKTALASLAKPESVWKVYSCGKVFSFCVWRLFRHLTPSHLGELWQLLLDSVRELLEVVRTLRLVTDVPAEITASVHTALSFAIEMLYFGIHHSNGRGVNHKAIVNSVGGAILSTVFDVTEVVLDTKTVMSDGVVTRGRDLFCQAWQQFPQHMVTVQRVDRILAIALPSMTPVPAVTVFAKQLLPNLPYSSVQRHLLQPILAILSKFSASDAAEQGSAWMGTLLEVLTKIHDPREDFSSFAGSIGAASYDADKTAEGTSGVAPRDADVNDDDSWNASGSDVSDSDEDSVASSHGGSDDGADEEQVPAEDKILYKTSSKMALAALLHSSQQISALAENCLEVVVQYVNLSSAGVKEKSKGSKKDKAETSKIADVATAMLSVKCLSWFLQCTPQILADSKALSGKKFVGVLTKVATEFDAVSKSILTTEAGLPFVAELCSLTGILAELDATFLNSAGQLKQFVHSALALLQEHSESVSLSWAVQSVLSRLSPRLLQAPHRHVLTVCLSAEEIAALLHVMGTALATPSFWLRYNWLRILTHLPPALLTDAEAAPGKNAQNHKSEVDVARICLEAVCLSPDIRHEREYARRVGVLEVHVRGGRLPTEYMRLVCGFCLGLLHFKFKPIWEPAVLVLVSAAKLTEGEAVLWPLLLKAIEATTSAANYTAESHAVVTVGHQGLIGLAAELRELDSGKAAMPAEVTNSELFGYRGTHNDAQLVEPDARTDSETVCATVWNVLKRSPNITLKRSKVVVGIFLNFLAKQYYQGFQDDPEVPYLRQIGLFSVMDQSSEKIDATAVVPVFPAKILKKRLEMFLQVFAAVTSPKQMYCHQLLYTFYQEIMAKADVNAVKLAFDCILTYKSASITPYKDNVKRMLEDKTIRDEMVNLDATPHRSDSEIDPLIKEEHRAELIPLLVRTVYGRFTSKSRGSKAARDQNIARRAAALAFISNLADVEKRHLLQLMLRGIVPADLHEASSGAPKSIDQWYDSIDHIIMSLDAAELDKIAWERQIGFLHLMQPIIRILGFGINAYVPIFHKVVLLMLNHAQNIRAKVSEATAVETDADVEDDEEHDATVANRSRDNVQALRVRSLCLLRIAEMIDQYHEVYNFMTNSDSFFDPLHPLIIALPTAVSSCRANCPAMLRIFHSLAQHAQTMPVLAARSAIVSSIVQCIASPQAFPEVMRYVIDILHFLLDFENGRAIYPHVELVIRSFSKRFVGPTYDEAVELKLSEMDVTPTGSVKSELKLLCRIASGIFQHTEVVISPVLISNLSILLLGMLRTYTTSRKIRVEEDWVIDILKIYQTLVFRIPDVTNQVAFISRLFGPTAHSFSLFNAASVRNQLVQVLGALNAHPTTHGLLGRSHKAIEDLISDDAKVIGSRDFERFMPVMQALSRETKHKVADESAPLTWSSLLGPSLQSVAAARELEASKKAAKSAKKGKSKADIEPPVNAAEWKYGARNAAMYSAVLYECLRCMYDSELIVRSASLAALKRLVSDSAEWSGCIEAKDESLLADVTWLDMLKSILVPAIRRGFKQSTDVVKRGFILLFAHLVRIIGSTELGKADEAFHGELSGLLHEDPEQDFFENIVHIQVHRRLRALTKLRNTLMTEIENPWVPTAASFNHVLLPVAYHYLFSDEFQKKDHLPLMQESAAFIGAVGKHLRWNHYLNTIKTLLKQLEKGKAEKEKVLLTAVCAMLDSFHFNLSGSRAAVLKALPDRQRLIDLINIPGKEVKGGRVVHEHIGEPAALPDDHDDPDERLEMRDDNGVEPDEEALVREDDDADGEEGNEGENATADVEVEEAEIAEPMEEEVPEEEDMSYVTIAQTLVNSVLPWVQVFLLKNGKDHKGNATRTVQPHVALALTKLIERLQEPVVTAQYKHNLFVNLVIRVVSTLKSHDTSGRDTARDCLAKMVLTLGLRSLKAVIFELQFALKEGFQRHVCNYTVRTLLRLVLVNYSPPRNAPSVPFHLLDKLSEVDIEPTKPDFDGAIPLIMQSALDDLAGGAQDDRDADEAVRSLIREAKGSKANDTLELTARNLLFRPTYALLALHDPASLSSIHAVTIPLLNSLQQQQMDKPNGALFGRIAEALQRIALGLSKNPSLEAKELLLYLHSTLQPFVGAIARDLARHREAMGRLSAANFTSKRKKDAKEVEMESEFLDQDMLDEALPSYLREESSDEDEQALYSAKKARGSRGDDVTGYRAATWLPSDRRSLLEQRAVVEARNREARARIEVQDGASAPRLTGRNKYVKNAPTKAGFNATGGTGGDRSTIVSIKYCLTLLYACLKQNKLDSRDPDVQAMAVPFLPLLGKCLQLPGASAVVALAVRCMTTLIGWGIPVESNFLTALGNRLMKLMFKGGGLVSTETELAQACTKGLGALFKIHNAKMAAYDESQESKKRQSIGGASTKSAGDSDSDPAKPTLPIAADNLRSLVQMLTVSIMEVTSTFQTAAFQLVREIVATRVLIPEIYDLVTRLAEQIVLSQRKGVREAATSVVVTFLVSYPLGEKRVSSQLKQLINNCEFEFEEGRAAALRALVVLIKGLPLPVLEDYAQMLFLPATLRVVNDKSAQCREQAAAVIVALSRKVGTDTVLQLQEYALKWLSAALPTAQTTAAMGIEHSATKLLDLQVKSLVRTGAQIASLVVQARPDMCKRDNHIAKLVQSVHHYLFVLLKHAQDSENARQRNSIEKRELSRFEEGQGELGRADSCWSMLYHLVCLCEQLYLHLPAAADHAVTHVTTDGSAEFVPLMELVQESLLFPHAWVRAVSVRVLHLYMKRRDVTRARLSTSADGVEIFTTPNGLYQLARRLCIVVNQTTMQASMLESVTACSVFVIRAMLRNPDLNNVATESLEKKQRRRSKQQADGAQGGDSDNSASDNEDDDEEGDNENDTDDEAFGDDNIPGEQEAQEAMHRAVEGEESEPEADDSDVESVAPADEDEVETGDSQRRKRKATESTAAPVKKLPPLQKEVSSSEAGAADADAVRKGGAHWVMQRLRGIGADSRGNKRIHVMKVFLAIVQAESAEFVTVYIEQIIEVAVRAVLAVDTTPDAAQSAVSTAKELSAELLERLEQTVGSDVFMGAYSAVQQRVQSSKAEKRRQLAAEAVREPQKYAMRKMENAKKKHEGKKRQTLKHAAVKGLKRKTSRSATVY